MRRQQLLERQRIGGEIGLFQPVRIDGQVELGEVDRGHRGAVRLKSVDREARQRPVVTALARAAHDYGYAGHRCSPNKMIRMLTYARMLLQCRAAAIKP